MEFFRRIFHAGGFEYGGGQVDEADHGVVHSACFGARHWLCNHGDGQTGFVDRRLAPRKCDAMV